MVYADIVNLSSVSNSMIVEAMYIPLHFEKCVGKSKSIMPY